MQLQLLAAQIQICNQERRLYSISIYLCTSKHKGTMQNTTAKSARCLHTFAPTRFANWAVRNSLSRDTIWRVSCGTAVRWYSVSFMDKSNLVRIHHKKICQAYPSLKCNQANLLALQLLSLYRHSKDTKASCSFLTVHVLSIHSYNCSTWLGCDSEACINQTPPAIDCAAVSCCRGSTSTPTVFVPGRNSS